MDFRQTILQSAARNRLLSLLVLLLTLTCLSCAFAQPAQRIPDVPEASGTDFDPARDSFDASKSPQHPFQKAQPTYAYPPKALPRPRPSEAPAGEDWYVVVPRAVLYSEPSESSTALGEFQRGAPVRVIAEHGAWVEITMPDHGFILKSDASSASDQLD